MMSAPWIKVFFCEGNPGHGYISRAYAAKQDAKDKPGAMVRKPDGGIEPNRHPGRVISFR